MSTTNRYTALCNGCGAIVVGGQGTFRRYNGAARRHAPGYARADSNGVLTALHCLKCESNRRQG